MSRRHYGGYGKRNGGGYRGRSRNSQPGRRIKSFDPTALVQKATPLETDIYKPRHSFTDFGLHPRLIQNIDAKGYRELTAIQDQVIPNVLAGRDVVGVANTGTGKTAAFLIPLIQKVVTHKNFRVLIISPTRELTNQTAAECRELSRDMQIYSSICIGGVSMQRQIEQVRRRPQFVIGTPGRLKDLHQRQVLAFSDYEVIVLDEVDQMLDMGFIADIRYIISHVGEKRQSLFFSATLSDKAHQVMQLFLKDPVIVSVKTSDTLSNIEQSIIRLAGRQKEAVLHELLSQGEFEKVLVFGGTKRKLNQLERNLRERGHRVGIIHGNKSQSQRERVLQGFRDNQFSTLLATDVASRGLDIENVTHVINYDMPQTYEDYIHRIGRTGRAEKFGVALTFVE
jgi:ATP-dependent RNA helicase RhlE